MQKRPDLIIGEKNQFRSFHVFHIIDKIMLKFRTKKYPPQREKQSRDEEKNFNPINAACYGGMFFHRDLIRRIGFPDERYVVYMDDFDFSYRNIRKGGAIYFVPHSVLNDQEESWNNVQNRFAFIQIALNNNHSALYYSIRNRVYFELKNNVDNHCVYAINLLIYSALVFFFALSSLKYKNILVYVRAVRDGLRQKMGVNPYYLL